MHNKKAIHKTSINTIKEQKLLFIEDLLTYLPCSKASFYDWNYNNDPDIKEALNSNRIRTKIGLRTKWYESTNATLQIALYKIIGNEEERSVLNNKEYKEESETSKYTINIIKDYGNTLEDLSPEDLQTVKKIFEKE